VRPTFLLAILLALAAPAFAQEPPVNYAVTIESPSSPALGQVSVRARVSGGVSEPEGVAYHLRTAGAWAQAQSLRLTRVAEGVFEDGIDTTLLENDAYRLEVRAWSDVPPYEPGDPQTYSRATWDFAVDNPPPTPQGVEALTPATSLRVGWRAVETSTRDDFAGYRVHVHRGSTCPSDVSAYRTFMQAEGLLFTQEKVTPGDYCVRVSAARSSALTDVVLSPPSPPVKISIARGNDPVVEGDGIVIETTEEVTPPPPPPLGAADPVISDGEFVEDLPYGSQTVTQEAEDPGSSEAVSLEAGVDPKRTPTLIAGGLILAMIAGLIRRFLATAPKA
jgi:hypothetical protein